MHLSPFQPWLAALILLAGLITGAGAQTAPAPPATVTSTAPLPELGGTAIDGKSFNLKSLRGKVVMVFFWSTDCAVCRDKMPELRANVQGWRSQPFEVVTVSEDRKKQDLLDYERLVNGTIPANQRFITLWAGESGYMDSFTKRPRLPETFIIDKQGRIAAHYLGRIPAEAWDKIADLL